MAATQRRTLTLGQPLHIKQEPLTMRTLAHSPIQHQQNAVPVKSETMQPIDLETRHLKHTTPSTNGFHQEASTASPSSSFLGGKSAKLQQFLEESANPESKRTVDMLLSQVQMLSAQEKMLLYLKLPGSKNGGGSQPQVDPLRQPINPLGTRHEIQQTITWIKTHLTEDPDVSLPKQDVYDEYMAYCEANAMKHLSTADFGKVMKQVFPRVRPRRLGTRGNSRYCYAGLCKRMRLDRPMLPDLGCDVELPITEKGDSNLEAAASFLIREWAQKLLGESFSNLRELASYLVDKMCVDGRSVAAFALLSATAENIEDEDSPASILAAKERDAQFERKVVEKEPTKRKGSQDSDKVESAGRPASECKRQRLKNGRNSIDSPVRRASESKKRPSPSASSSSVSPAPTTPATKMIIPRLSTGPATVAAAATTPTSGTRSSTSLISPLKQQQPQQTQQQQQNKKYKRIQPKPEPPLDAGEEANFFNDLNSSELIQEPLGMPNLEPSAFDDYLNGGNSQEQEDHELMTYFTHTSNSPAASTNPEPPAQPVTNEEPAKISQLRRLLEGNERVVKESTKRRVSFENPTFDTVPASPNTRRRVFNFLPISPDDVVPGILQAPPPSPASTATSASPFVSPANTPVPRSRNNSGNQFIYPSRTRHSSAPKPNLTVRGRNFSGPAPLGFDLHGSHSTMLAPPDGRQRHVSAQQLQLHELLGHETFLSDTVLPNMHQFRSQSVPLHQMIGATNNSSIAPTPVPSEFNDFDTSESFQLDQLLMGEEDILDEAARATVSTSFNSRSFPNTPVTEIGGPTLLPSLLAEQPASSRSYPTTPVINAPDPVISQLTLNAINQPAALGGTARRNLSELIDQSSSFSADEQAMFQSMGTEFGAPPEQNTFDDFDQSELTQLVQEVEGSASLLQDESLS
ncbi:uncharacterized protein LOC132194508 [Neocloeon triangulifer]|uniref:uncharacterized protein LOC132194508 n=1 Tax=Neocloeon triangulifer TaxID=2078957 RepID=UPI00286FAC4B|nr:uncharacterized protein LOC132194508 [Neocloeon triangulifer]